MVSNKIKKFKINLTEKQLFFVSIFAVIALIAQQINFSALVMSPGASEKPYLTFFQFAAPMAGAFLGGILGVTAVLLSELVTVAYNTAILSKPVATWTILGMLPILAAVWYFSKNRENTNTSIAIPIIASIAFWAHPVGQQAWFFPLIFWSIPVIAKIFFSENLLAKSLGATMAAHSVGGALWIWVFPTTAAYWMALVPVVAFERAIFALGIAGSYLATNALLHYAVSHSRTMRELSTALNLHPNPVALAQRAHARRTK